MEKLMEAIEQVRWVRRARDEFMVRAFVERFIIGPMLLDRLAADLECRSSFARHARNAVRAPGRLDDD
ncbi:MAG TPA: hypothetical protein VFC78_16010 [Tepidisphaeraceae bacterium]|nr:hypothetical protein [Tepidisphaeraceae bacterium]